MADDKATTPPGSGAESRLEFGAAEPEEDVLAGELSLGDKVADRTGIVRELFGFLWANKLWWMVPMVVVLLLFSLVMVLATATPLGPFIYTLF